MPRSGSGSIVRRKKLVETQPQYIGQAADSRGAECPCKAQDVTLGHAAEALTKQDRTAIRATACGGWQSHAFGFESHDRSGGSGCEQIWSRPFF